MKSIFIFLAASLFCINSLSAAEKWEVPEEEEKRISIRMFNEDMVAEGQAIYENSCQSCHGTPTEENFTLMSPSPGDPASDKFQNQSDGSMFYKIKTGRNAMPGFSHIYSDNEIWSIIAYIRSFNDKYEQPIPDLTGIYIPELDARIGFDPNVDKIEVFVTDRGKPADSVIVAAYLKGTFGLFPLGRKPSDKDGYADFDIDVTMPGDEQGFAHVIVKLSKGYGYKKVEEKFQILKPKKTKSAIEGRHLWSTDAMAPIWLKVIFFGTLIGIWAVMFIVLNKLFKLKKLA